MKPERLADAMQVTLYFFSFFFFFFYLFIYILHLHAFRDAIHHRIPLRFKKIQKTHDAVVAVFMPTGSEFHALAAAM